MVGPMIVSDSSAEVPIRVVRVPLRRIDDIVLVAMFLIKKICNLSQKNRIRAPSVPSRLTLSIELR